jgi:hypothetical protein
MQAFFTSSRNLLNGLFRRCGELHIRALRYLIGRQIGRRGGARHAELFDEEIYIAQISFVQIMQRKLRHRVDDNTGRNVINDR